MTQPDRRSPSGLFRPGVWEAEMERSHAVMPRWYWNEAERRRRYARWVEAEAEGLAMRLLTLLHPETPADVADPARTLVAALARDAEWARGLPRDETLPRDEARNAA